MVRNVDNGVEVAHVFHKNMNISISFKCCFLFAGFRSKMQANLLLDVYVTWGWPSSRDRWRHCAKFPMRGGSPIVPCGKVLEGHYVVFTKVFQSDSVLEESTLQMCDIKIFGTGMKHAYCKNPYMLKSTM